VIEFDKDGKFLQAWGEIREPGVPGPQDGYDWPWSEHGLYIDYRDNVWITGSNPTAGSGSDVEDGMVLKFNNKGKFLLQIGHRDVKAGNKDTKNFRRATKVSVYPRSNEVFVSDGYANRRVIVLDADTGAFKRLWGAFGNEPSDGAPSMPPREYEGNSGPCTVSLCRMMVSSMSATETTSVSRFSRHLEST
jgi:hypothetical protein